MAREHRTGDDATAPGHGWPAWRRRGWALLLAAVSLPALATPRVPASDAEILGEVPAGAHHAELAARRMARGRVDVAVPLAQFYIGQSRATGDLRFLGYAEAVLGPWVEPGKDVPAALVLLATLQQSRHEFAQSLRTLDRSLAARPRDPQAWLTRATVLRVMGRYPEAEASCRKFAEQTDATLGAICRESVLGLHGALATAYAALEQLSPQGLAAPERAWRDSELGEMAVRLGNDAAAERWFRDGLVQTPADFYVRAAYADLLLRHARAREALTLLQGGESIEPLLLRIAIAQKQLHDPGLAVSRARLGAAFSAEAARGEAIHRRELARYLLEVEGRPRDALAEALQNWQLQREPDDALVLVDAARAAGSPASAAPALDFLAAQGLRDARLARAPGAAVRLRS